MKFNLSKKTGQQQPYNSKDQEIIDVSIHEYKTYFPHNNF